jgi:hypothetical protein
VPPISAKHPTRFVPSGLELDRFEQVLTGEDRVLLRVLGRYHGQPGAASLDAVLIADDGLHVHRHDPLPDLTAGAVAAQWRAGFDVALDLLEDRRVAFAIETGEGILLDLPHPDEYELLPLIHSTPGFTTRKARRHLALVAGMLAAASIPMGIPAIAITQDEAAQTDPTALCTTDPQAAAAQGIACPAPAAAPTPTGTSEPAAAATPTDTATAAQQAQAAVDQQEPAPAAADEPPAAVQEEPAPTAVDGVESTPGTSDAPVLGAGDDPDEPQATTQTGQPRSGSGRGARPQKDTKADDGPKSGTRGNGSSNHTGGSKAPVRTRGGAPTQANPSFFDALPGPSTSTAVPNFVIRKFRVPVFLLPIYQAAGIEYGVRWEYLAAINEIETDYGRNLNVSSAGALGWMQFMPATWKMYGVDANKDGKKDPFNPVDAIFASARYLKAAGAPGDMRKAIFAYNHADWYVDSVVLRAKLIAGIPTDLVGSLTGLTEGRFPVAARARYADDLAERDAQKKVKAGQNAANVINTDDTRRGIDVYAKEGSPVVATTDGVIKKIGKDRFGKRIVVLQDAYGNRYTYRDLGSVSRFYPVPKADTAPRASDVAPKAAKDPKPTSAATAGKQAQTDDAPATRREPQAATPTIKQRLFANPQRPQARRAGGEEQLFSAGPAKNGKWETYKAYFTRGFGLNARNAKLRPLKKGSQVVASTVLGQVGAPTRDQASHLRFEIRPAGRGAPSIDPKPILDGWKLLESTAIYRASGKNVLHGDDADGFSIGQIMLLPKPMLEKRVLADNRIEIYPGGRQDIRTGQVDRRVLALLEYLAEVGLRPTVSSLRSGHSYLTASGNVSEHSMGTAVDIARINGVPILGHQEPGGVTEQAVRRIMQLQGTMTPHQVISLLDFGGPTVAMGDHDDHIHVGFRPLFGDNKKLGRQAMAVLKPGQWNDLIDRLGQIENPVVPTKPSRYAIPVRGSHAHKGE